MRLMKWNEINRVVEREEHLELAALQYSSERALTGAERLRLEQLTDKYGETPYQIAMRD